MKIGGFQKLSLKDYPSHLSSIIFTSGCNFRCGYCHNPQLFNSEQIIPEKEVFDFLEKRKFMLDGVVITGGEPTLQPDLLEFIKKIKQLNLKVKLDTNGSNPDLIKQLIEQNLLDYIAMDYKYPLEQQEKITKYKNTENILESKNLIQNSNLKHEFRITLIEELFSDNILKQLAKELKGCTVTLQPFRNETTLSLEFRKYKNTSEEFVNKAKYYFI